MEGDWNVVPVGQMAQPVGLERNDLIEFMLADDSNVYDDRAGQLNWSVAYDDAGRITHWRRMVPAAPPVPKAAPVAVGDVNGTTKGSGARYNSDKPALELIPASIMAALRNEAYGFAPRAVGHVDWPLVLESLSLFQMRQPGSDARRALLHALHVMNHDGLLWADVARVFDYGRRKYSAWNWARGMAWSIPIGCALRHIVLGDLRGETNDPESGEPHRGHVGCNIVMLLWFLEYYPEGDDRPVLPAA